MKRRLALALVALLIFGALRLPYETQLEKEHKAAYFHGATLNLELRQQVTQEAFVAALSGFRTSVADGYFIKAHIEWGNAEYGRMISSFNAATALQPRCILFWDQAAWHMAYNGSINAYDKAKDQREAYRIKAVQDFWDLGRDYLKRGIANNPDKPDLYVSLGNLFRDKYQDHCAAAEAYGEGATKPGALSFVHRAAAYELAQCPGREREAYEKLLGFYKSGEDEHLPSLLKWLGILQEKLDIPADQRVNIPPAAAHP